MAGTRVLVQSKVIADFRIVRGWFGSFRLQVKYRMMHLLTGTLESSNSKWITIEPDEYELISRIIEATKSKICTAP